MRKSAALASVLLIVLSLSFFLVPLASAQGFPGTGQSQTTTTTSTVTGSPEIDLSAPDNRLEPGTTQTVTVQLSNSGHIEIAGESDLEQRVQTARNLRLEVADEDLPEGVELRSGPVLVGNLGEGRGESVTFTFDVSEDVNFGTHNIPIEIRYDYTRLAQRETNERTRFRDRTEERIENLEMVVEEDARFSVTRVSSDVIAGATGIYSIRVENTGTQPARNPRITFSSESEGIFFGALEDRMRTRTVGMEPLEPFDSRTVRTRVAADPEITPSAYPVSVKVTYETGYGVSRESRTITTLVEVADEQDFVAEDVRSTLRVGSDGFLTGEVRNQGPRDVTNAVVVFDPENSNINPRETKYAVGSLPAGETAEFRYRVSVSSEADEGPRQSSVFVEYRNPDDYKKTSSAVDVNYEVAEEIDEFALESNTSIAAGSSGPVEIEVTNIRNETLTDIQPKMFVDDPLSTDDDEAFIERLEPGESETVVFGISASGGATPKSYSASVDFRYEDERGDTEISETYRVPVRVTESEGGGSNTPAVVGVVLVAALAVLGWWKRDLVT